MNVRLLLVVVSLLFLCACTTTMTTNPQVAALGDPNFRISGKVIYDGNREYLPRTIADEPGADVGLTFQYRYNAVYGSRDVPDMIALLNPLDIIGCPTGNAKLTIIGRLDILKGGKVIKTYTATSVGKRTRNLFSEGGTFSEMRKKGLMAVRDNIEAQMYQNRDFLNTLSSSR